MINKNISFSILCFILLSLQGLSIDLQEAKHYSTLDLTEIQTPAIDSLDTVIFDLSQAVYGSNTVYFPVYFSSDDLIYALDFALRYVDSRLVYDTITLAPAGSGLLAYSFLNPADSTVRFTSSQFVALPNRQPIAFVHFELIPGTTSLDTTDFYNLRGLLNGDPCTELVIPPGVTSLNEPVLSVDIKVFPNPTTQSFSLCVDEPGLLWIIGSNANELFSTPVSVNRGENRITLPANCAPGTYLLKFLAGKRLGSAYLLVGDK
jgi:hypothetical protein